MTPNQDLPAEKTEECLAIEQAIRESVLEVARRNRLLGRPMVVSRDGEVVWIPPEELPAEE